MKIDWIDEMPSVSVGMPVYNSEATIGRSIESILAQTFGNFELIISDNASTDNTQSICESYADRDVRIKYIRQESNLGGTSNFIFALNQAKADYFMWAAGDDFWSTNFIEINLDFLRNNNDYVASTCPNTFENWNTNSQFIDFSLNQNSAYERFICFFRNCFKSHGLFYSLSRTGVLKDCPIYKRDAQIPDWLGFDWATILYLATLGKLNRVSQGKIIFGVHGLSGSSDVFKKFNSINIEWFIPFYLFSKFVINQIVDWPRSRKIVIFKYLLYLNIYANIEPLRAYLRSQIHLFYRLTYKPLIKFFKGLK